MLIYHEVFYVLLLKGNRWSAFTGYPIHVRLFIDICDNFIPLKIDEDIKNLDHHHRFYTFTIYYSKLKKCTISDLIKNIL